MSLTIGNLDCRITLQFSEDSTDEQGSVIKTWRDSAKVWAAVKVLESAETIEGNARLAIQACEFTVRYQRAIASTGPSYRVKYEGQFFDIVAVNPMPLGRPGFLVFSTVRTADVQNITFDSYYFLNAEGGRFSDGDGGFFRVDPSPGDVSFFLNDSRGRFITGDGTYLISN